LGAFGGSLGRRHARGRHHAHKPRHVHEQRLQPQRRAASRRAFPREPGRQHVVAHAAVRGQPSVRRARGALHGVDAQARRIRLPLRLRPELRQVNAQRGSTRAIWSWALFDFANSPFTTIVVTFVYATYFTNAIAADAISGTELWSRAVSITAVIVAVASPVFGA